MQEKSERGTGDSGSEVSMPFMKYLKKKLLCHFLLLKYDFHLLLRIMNRSILRCLQLAMILYSYVIFAESNSRTTVSVLKEVSLCTIGKQELDKTLRILETFFLKKLWKE